MFVTLRKSGDAVWWYNKVSKCVRDQRPVRLHMVSSDTEPAWGCEPSGQLEQKVWCTSHGLLTGRTTLVLLNNQMRSQSRGLALVQWQRAERYSTVNNMPAMQSRDIGEP